MPELDPVSERLGALTSSVENLRAETGALSAKFDILLANYAKADDLRELERRTVKLEHAETQRKANLKILSWAGGAAGALLGLIVLFFSGTWDHWFGKVH